MNYTYLAHFRNRFGTSQYFFNPVDPNEGHLYCMCLVSADSCESVRVIRNLRAVSCA